MERERNSGMMEVCIKANIKKDESMALVNLFGRMEVSIKGILK